MDKRQRSHVLSVEVEQVKSDEDALATTEKQITEHWPACIIDASNLTVEGHRSQREDARRSHVARSAKLRNTFCQRLLAANGKYAGQSDIYQDRDCCRHECQTTEHKERSGEREAEEQDDHQDAN